VANYIEDGIPANDQPSQYQTDSTYSHFVDVPNVFLTISKTARCHHLKPNSITLAGSKLVGDQLRTSFEPASVMEFGLVPCVSNTCISPLSLCRPSEQVPEYVYGARQPYATVSNR